MRRIARTVGHKSHGLVIASDTPVAIWVRGNFGQSTPFSTKVILDNVDRAPIPHGGKGTI